MKFALLLLLSSLGYSQVIKQNGSSGSSNGVPITPTSVTASTVTVNGNGSQCFSADNPTLVVDCGNHRVGVGTATPGTKLNISSGVLTVDGTSPGIIVGSGTFVQAAPLQIQWPISQTNGSLSRIAQFISNDNTNPFELYFSAIGNASATSRDFIWQTAQDGLSNSGNLIAQNYGGNFGVGTLIPVTMFEVGSGALTVARTIGTVGVNTEIPSAQLEVRSSTAPTNFVLDVSSTNGTAMFDVLGNGSVGIATTTPNISGDNVALTIAGGNIIDSTPALEFQSSRTSATGRLSSIYVFSGTSRTNRIDFQKDGSGSSGKFLFVPSGSGGGDAPATVITSTGNMGIGTSSPATRLHVSSGVITVDGTSPAINISTSAQIANSLFDAVGGGTFTILTNGNVGINNATPGALLHISSGTEIIDGPNPFLSILNASNVGKIAVGAVNLGQGVLSVDAGQYDAVALDSRGRANFDNVQINSQNNQGILTTVALSVKAQNNQTGDLTEWKNTNNVVLASVTVGGAFNIGPPVAPTAYALQVSSANGTGMFNVLGNGQVSVASSTWVIPSTVTFFVDGVGNFTHRVSAFGTVLGGNQVSDVNTNALGIIGVPTGSSLHVIGNDGNAAGIFGNYFATAGGPGIVGNNKGDFAGAVAIGAGYAEANFFAPVNGLMVQGSVAVSTRIPTAVFEVGGGTQPANFMVKVSSQNTGMMFGVLGNGVIVSSSVIPTISCNAGTGTLSSDSTNTFGSFTAGAAAANCTVTFSNNGWPTNARCVVVDDTSLISIRVSAQSNTAFTVAGTTISGDVIQYICLGN